MSTSARYGSRGYGSQTRSLDKARYEKSSSSSFRSFYNKWLSVQLPRTLEDAAAWPSALPKHSQLVSLPPSWTQVWQCLGSRPQGKVCSNCKDVVKQQAQQKTSIPAVLLGFDRGAQSGRVCCRHGVLQAPTAKPTRTSSTFTANAANPCYCLSVRSSPAVLKPPNQLQDRAKLNLTTSAVFGPLLRLPENSSRPALQPPRSNGNQSPDHNRVTGYTRSFVALVGALVSHGAATWLQLKLETSEKCATSAPSSAFSEHSSRTASQQNPDCNANSELLPATCCVRSSWGVLGLLAV